MMLIINKLLYYGKHFLELEETDLIYAQNQIIDYLKITYFQQEIVSYLKIDELESPSNLLEELYLKALKLSIINEFEEDLFKTKIMGFLSISNKEINSNFWDIYHSKSSQEALNYLFDYGIKNFYIKKEAIEKNIIWYTKKDENKLKITINLSKPEKDNKEIAKLLAFKDKEEDKKYPLCMLCKSNLGFVGTIKYPARQTLRFVQIKLADENWFMQYSPYAYFYKHCIVINDNHVKMDVNDKTVYKLFDFIDLFPSFFIGSNASLPIVGGSILNHEHFQGGEEVLPLRKATTKKTFQSNVFKDVEVFEINWYARSIRLQSKNRLSIQKLYEVVLLTWQNYENKEIDIISKTNKDTLHNAITPIAYKNEDNYVLDLIFRNNYCNFEHKDGIFHAHKEYHNIKKEGIGLIEAMGLFVLPGRLKEEIDLMSETIFYPEKNFEINEKIIKHQNLMKEIKGEKLFFENITLLKDYVKEKIDSICMNILNNISVFKNDEKGNEAFTKFMEEVGF